MCIPHEFWINTSNTPIIKCINGIECKWVGNIREANQNKKIITQSGIVVDDPRNDSNYKGLYLPLTKEELDLYYKEKYNGTTKDTNLQSILATPKLSRLIPKKKIKKLINGVTHKWETDVSQKHYEENKEFFITQGYILDEPHIPDNWGGLYLKL